MKPQAMFTHFGRAMEREGSVQVVCQRVVAAALLVRGTAMRVLQSRSALRAWHLLAGTP